MTTEMEIVFGACFAALLLFTLVMTLVNKRIDKKRTTRSAAAATQDDPCDPWIDPKWRDPMMPGS